MNPVRCGVAGSPIAHSLSPVLHRAAYDALGLDWRYAAHEVDEAGLTGFLADLCRDWRGLSLTMPLKEAALAACAEIGETARLVSAVNTIVIDAAGRRVGHNTDVAGFVAAWREGSLVPSADGSTGAARLESAVVIGGGATARSALAALAEIGCRRVTVLSRSAERAAALTALFGELGMSGTVGSLASAAPHALGPVQLVVSTVPAPAHADVLASPAVRALLARRVPLFDVTYGPRDSALVSAARRAGGSCSDGFPLLLHQAVGQVELFTGCTDSPLEAMRAAGLASLRARAEREREPG